MRSVWEHVNGLNSHYSIERVKVVKIARLCGRITAYIDNALWGSIEYGLYHIGMHACTWRIGDDDIRTSVA